MNNYDDLLSNAPAGEQQHRQLTQEEKAEYGAKKQGEREELYALSDATALEVSGDGGKFKQYLDMQAKVGRSAVNTLLIMAQMPEATRVADYDTWKDLGGYVKRNPVPIYILDAHDYTKDDKGNETWTRIRDEKIQFASQDRSKPHALINDEQD